MTRDEIIRMGSEADLFIYNSDDPTLIVWLIPTEEKFLKFAALVAAAEREACAVVCERISKEFVFEPRSPDPVYCADAIRARGESK
jgi:hypothetical protein